MRKFAQILRMSRKERLCDPVRIALVGRLASAGRPLTVTDASSCCGIHFSGVSRHLAILLRAGVVKKQKQGREVFYELEAAKIAATMRGVADALDAASRRGNGVNRVNRARQGKRATA
jgi:DNA-binding transcriptional ArsR family regulator